MAARTRAIKNSTISCQSRASTSGLGDLRSVGWNFAGYLQFNKLRLILDGLKLG